MNGTEKQVELAENIKVQFKGYWVNLENKYRGSWEDPEGADEVAQESSELLQTIAPYSECAGFWIDWGKRLSDRGSVKMLYHGIKTYPRQFEQYL